MNIKLTKSGEILEVSDCWGRRLMEQGMAVRCPKKTEASPAPQARKSGKKAAETNGAD